MGFIIDDKSFINDNIFKYEKRLESQYSIFTEKNPTFVTYYHINNINSITDSGLLNVDNILGKESPLKFQEIKDFPIYGIEQIKIDLNEDDEGITGSYEGDGIILPNTIKPFPNDFFTISYLDKNYLFMVTQIDYDTIKSNNFYKINFMLRSTSGDQTEQLQGQVLEKYNCVFKNIGTEENCLIQEDAFIHIKNLQEVYSNIIKEYLPLFYNKKYNSFLFKTPTNIIYDKFLANFINRTKVFNEKDQYRTIILSNEDYGEQFDITYNMSIYEAIENKKIDELDYIRYEYCPITYPHSIFLYYNLKDVKSIAFVPDHVGKEIYLPDRLIDGIKCNEISEDMSIIEKLIIEYFNNRIESIFQIDIEKIKSYKIRYTMNDYIMIPILLFILKHYIDKFLHI